MPSRPDDNHVIDVCTGDGARVFEINNQQLTVDFNMAYLHTPTTAHLLCTHATHHILELPPFTHSQFVAANSIALTSKSLGRMIHRRRHSIIERKQE